MLFSLLSSGARVFLLVSFVATLLFFALFMSSQNMELLTANRHYVFALANPYVLPNKAVGRSWGPLIVIDPHLFHSAVIRAHELSHSADFFRHPFLFYFDSRFQACSEVSAFKTLLKLRAKSGASASELKQLRNHVIGLLQDHDDYALPLSRAAIKKLLVPY